MRKTLFDKIWDQHVVKNLPGGRQVIYIDHHFIHEVTSPQAFAELKERNLPVFRKEQITATADHNVPTKNQHLPIEEPMSRKQVTTLTENCNEHNITLYGLGHEKQGIVHVIGPELGITQPGMTIVCGDSHTSTHGAFGNISFGIGTSQVAQVFASQCLILQKPKKMRININGKINPMVTSKDIILFLLSKLGVGGGTGFFIEYAGEAIESLGMEARMTICNMSIEMGAKGGLIAPNETTFNYLKGKPNAPSDSKWEDAVEKWKQLYSDEDALFDQEYYFNADEIPVMITYGTNPGMAFEVNEKIPSAADSKALNYMGLKPNEQLIGKKIQHVFIGSCTNARLEDLKIVANFIKGKQKAPGVQALIVPGSQNVANQIKQEGLIPIFEDAGFELREAGCSACLGMNEDKIPAGEYCVSTSNRNFEGRQGPGSRTFLASPLTAAAAAIYGEIVDVRNI